MIFVRYASFLAALCGVAIACPASEAAFGQVSCPPVEELTHDLPADPTEAMRHIRYLADDRLEGREVGSRGAWCAGEYIAGALRSLGLTPAGSNHDFFHRFSVRKGVRLGSANALRVAGRAYMIDSEWVPLGFSASGHMEHALVYGGHGLTGNASGGNDGEAGKDDAEAAGGEYARMDISGRIVVVEWGDPDAPQDSPWTLPRKLPRPVMWWPCCPASIRIARTSISL